MAKTAMLICEGTCNRNIKFLDEAVSKVRKEERGTFGTVCSLPEPLIDALGKLQHTPHYELREDRWACIVCGRSRQYGAHGRHLTTDLVGA